MANDGYIYNPGNEITDSLKIFIGKCAEIKMIERAGKVVNRKWYLAWDTGEIYVGNGVRKLNRYGGTGSALSEDDIKKLIDTYTKTDLNAIRSQLTSALQNYNSISTATTTLQKNVTDALENLNKNTFLYIQQKINEVLNEATDLTYSKDKIDTLFTNYKQEISNNYVSNEALDTSLQQYAKSEDINATKLNYSTGDNLLMLLGNKIKGYYLCVSDSTDSGLTFEQGNLYSLVNGSYTNIGGTGSGGSAASPEINISIKDLTEEIIELGTSYNLENTRIDLNISSPKLFYGALTLYLDNKIILSGVSAYETYISKTINLIDPSYGKHFIKLSGVDRSSKTISGQYDINVMAPIYYGLSGPFEMDEYDIKLLEYKELKDDIKGSYEIQVSDGKYIWFCIPEQMKVTNFTSNGFKVPVNTPIIKTLTFGNLTNKYNCYRTANSFIAGNYIIDIS